jgi:hypothetical protein
MPVPLNYAEAVSTTRPPLLIATDSTTVPATRRALLLGLLSVIFGAVAWAAQEGSEGEAYQFVSGVVAAVSRDRITVRRMVSGKAPENHTFLIVPETRVEGSLRVQARVTVGYRRTERGDVAVRIIVRPEENATPRKE